MKQLNAITINLTTDTLMIKSGFNPYSHRLYLVLILLISATFTACEDEPETDGTNFTESVTVEALEQRVGVLPLAHRTTGEMRARNQVDIYPEISARIVSVNVNDGDRVSQGDTLVQLRDDFVREQLNQAEYDYEISRAQLRQSEAELRRLQAQYERVKLLRERELETKLELETLQADIDAAEASVDLAEFQMERALSQVEEQKSNLENTVVRAPIAGVVGNRNAEQGQRVSDGDRLFQIGDTDNMRIHVMLTERMSTVIQPGDRAELVTSLDDNQNPVEAVVERISPFLDPITHTTIAQLEVRQNSSGLQPGMFVTVDIFYGESDRATLIPKTALYDHPVENQTGIYIADMSNVERELEFEDESDERARNITPRPIPVKFVPVHVLAESRGVAGIETLDDPEAWIVTIGQHQLAEMESEEAFVREVDWDHVIDLQNRQSRDMESIIFGENSN